MVRGVAPVPGDRLQFAGTARIATDNDFPAGTEFQSLEIAASGFQISGNSFAVTNNLAVELDRQRHDDYLRRYFRRRLADAGRRRDARRSPATTPTPAPPRSAPARSRSAPGPPERSAPAASPTTAWCVFDRTNALTVANVISGTGEVLDAGSGTLTLSAANSFHGFTMFYYGTVCIGNVGAIPSGTGYADVGLNGVFDLNGYSISLNGINGSGTITDSAAESCTLTVGVNGESSDFGGVIEDGSGGVALTKVGAGTFETLGRQHLQRGDYGQRRSVASRLRGCGDAGRRQRDRQRPARIRPRRQLDRQQRHQRHGQRRRTRAPVH